MNALFYANKGNLIIRVRIFAGHVTCEKTSELNAHFPAYLTNGS